MQKKIGIFGGTFNPIHNGHINIINQMIKELNLDILLLMPTNVSYHKELDYLPSKIHRVNMCRLACDLNKKMELSTIDIDRTGPTYTYDTISILKSKYPESMFWLLIGSDSLKTFNTWYKYKEIINNINIAVAVRNNDNEINLKQTIDYLSTKPKNIKYGKIKLLNNSVINTNSSEIRLMIKNQLDVSNLIPKNIYDYIKKNNLYQI